MIKTTQKTLLDQVDEKRKEISPTLDANRKSELGQFMTPARIARFMAGFFPPPLKQSIRLLDAGAGIGSLSIAFFERFSQNTFNHFQVTAYEIDAHLEKELELHLLELQDLALSEEIFFSFTTHCTDFIEAAINQMKKPLGPKFTHAILNPPYKKIHGSSLHRTLLRTIGIETVNLYSAFVSLAIELLEPGGEIVAILPRSFCNGLYYRAFREHLLANTVIHRIHLFESRQSAFKEDEVLQENLIVHLSKTQTPTDVSISTSQDDSFRDLTVIQYPFHAIVKPGDREKFIHIPTQNNAVSTRGIESLAFQPPALGIDISTGPIVDFRLKSHLRSQPELGTAPLLYPIHFTNQKLCWPKENTKKANAIVVNDQTEKWLYPTGYYTVVRRFSSKEEKRRIIATVVEPKHFSETWLGFENHLNVFHSGKKGLSEEMAWGLFVFLNSIPVDHYFRQFNGNTQVNATDLRLLPYPSREVLHRLGAWAKQKQHFLQEEIDKKVQDYL